MKAAIGSSAVGKVLHDMLGPQQIEPAAAERQRRDVTYLIVLRIVGPGPNRQLCSRIDECR